MFNIFYRLKCAILGHDEYMRFQKNRMYLWCPNCYYESPGWVITRPEKPIRFATEEEFQKSLKVAESRHVRSLLKLEG